MYDHFIDLCGDEDDYDRKQEIARSAFADMCHDWERNQKYDQALQVTIQRLHASGQEAHVLDIGTGSGLLSMMAVRAGADSVTACEAFRPMADCAERVIHANGMSERIRLVKKKSTEMIIGKDMDRKANVLVTELLDTELIGEGALATYRHALEHLLENGCRVIPDKATIFVQLVECPLAMSWQMPKVLSNSDGNILLRTPNEITDCRGSSAVFDVQLSQLPLESFNALSEPVPVFEFDWSNKNALEFKRHSRKSIRAINSGVPQAVFMWWDLKMDLEGSIYLSCAPFWAHPDFRELKQKNHNNKIPVQNLIPWRDHWMQAIYYLPYTKDALIKGQELALDSYHDEFSLWFGLENSSLEPAHCSCGLHIAYSRSRIGQLNDGPRNKRILNYMEQTIDKNSIVLVIGDGSLLGLSLRALGAKKIILLEENQLSRRCMQSFIHFNKLDSVEIMSSLVELKPETAEQITHVFSECYFNSAILPWDNAIKFGSIWENVKGLLKKEVIIVPKSFSIYGVPVEFLDLHKINAPLGSCEGFNLSIMDSMIEEHSNEADYSVEAQPLWEYPSFPLGLQCELITINFIEESLTSDIEAKGKMVLSLDHVFRECNGIALWAVWQMDTSRSIKTTISTGPLLPIEDVPAIDTVSMIRWNVNWRQGVHLLKKNTIKKEIDWQVKFSRKLVSCYFHFNV